VGQEGSIVPGVWVRKEFVFWFGGGSNLKVWMRELELKYGFPKKNILKSILNTTSTHVRGSGITLVGFRKGRKSLYSAAE
jgi:hypothetical protein